MKESVQANFSTHEEPQGTDLARVFHSSVMTRALALGLGVAALSRSAQAAPNGFRSVRAFFDDNPGNYSTSNGTATVTIDSVQIPGSGDQKVLNFALALEDLEADLYRQALARLTGGGTSGTGTTIPGLNLGGPDVDYLNTFGRVEREHAAFVRSASQSIDPNNVIPVFFYDFGLENLDRLGVLQLVYAAELTGVSAYLGATPRFASKTYVPAASAILGTEARHTAVIAGLLNSSQFGQQPVSVAPNYNENNGRDTPLTPDQILVTGGTVAASVTLPNGGRINPVTSTNNGFVFVSPG